MYVPREKYYNRSGIYIIKNVETGQEYLGSSVNLYNRLKQHGYELDNGIHCNTHLQNSWNKYGRDSFEWSIEFEYDEIEEPKLRWIENLLIETLDLLNEDKGFNLMRVEDGQTYLRSGKSERISERKPVIRYNINTGEIDEFSRTSDASKHNALRLTIEERRVTNKKYLWFYKESMSIDELKKSILLMDSKNRTNNKTVLDAETGVYYNSVREVSAALGLKTTTFKYRVSSGFYKNRFLILK